MGFRKTPLKYFCQSCLKESETFNTGNKGIYCSRECRDQGFRKSTWENPGRFKQRGYWMLKINQNGKHIYKYEHVYIWEKHTGQKRKRCSIIRHINGNKGDNRIENLEYIENMSHLKAKKIIEAAQ